MDYTITELCDLSGLSARTLRFYDEIGLLKPKGFNPSGYRTYGDVEIDLLQQILFFRCLEIPLLEIKKIMKNPHYESLKALENHRQELLKKKTRMDDLINSIDLTIQAKKEGKNMANDLKFKALKNEQLKANEGLYGKEIRQKYGKETIEKSNQKFKNMDQATYDLATRLATEIISTLLKAMDSGDVHGELAKKTVELHKQWLMIYWPVYSKEGHKGLGDMYVADERFKAYYDQHRLGAAQFLRDAIYAHV